MGGEGLYAFSIAAETGQQRRNCATYTGVSMATTVDTIAPLSAGTPSGLGSPSGERGKGPWIYSAWLDLLVGCGAWSAPLLLIAALVTPNHGHAWAVAFYALAIVFNYPHFMATEYRAYRTREDFEKYKFFTLHLTLLLVLTGVLAHTFPRLVPWIFTLYICWSPWHYTGQNYGLLLMFVRRGGATMERIERRWLRAAFVASFVMLLASFETGGSNDPLILSLGLPSRFTVPARAVLGFAFVVCAYGAFRGLVKRSGWRAMVAPLTLLATQFLWFVLPTLIELGGKYQIPQTRYSSGILAVLHSAQYLWITSYYQQRDARAAGQSNWKMSGYWLALIAGGIALFIPGPWLVSYVFRFDFTTSFLIFTALVNIHHFMLDGAIWKLRDKRVASRLIEPSAKPDGAPARLMGMSPTPAPSFARRVLGSTTFRVAAVAMIFLIGGMDQVRFALGTDSTNLRDLSRAERLNPYDSAVDARIASLQLADRKPTDAIESLSQAVAVNPYDEADQQQLARALIQAGRYQDAYAHYQKMLALFPHDADALLDDGVLAAELGHTDEAKDAWERALTADPSEIYAHMYLASLFDQRHDYKTAVQHWYAFLQLAANRQGVDPIAPDEEIPALVQLSDDEERLNETDAAMTGYRSAAALAERVGSFKVQSLTLVHLAAAQEKAGDAKGAADSYQKALAADAKSNDAASAASDWFDYGQFLERHGKPDDLAYACVLESADLLKRTGNPALDAVVTERNTLETRLGPVGAARAQKDEASLTATAAHLAPSSF